MRKVLVNEPVLNGNEKKYIDECIDTNWISFEGSFVKRFRSFTGISARITAVPSARA